MSLELCTQFMLQFFRPFWPISFRVASWAQGPSVCEATLKKMDKQTLKWVFCHLSFSSLAALEVVEMTKFPISVNHVDLPWPLFIKTKHTKTLYEIYGIHHIMNKSYDNTSSFLSYAMNVSGDKFEIKKQSISDYTYTFHYRINPLCRI